MAALPSEAAPEQPLELYARLMGKTVLRPWSLPFTLSSNFQSDKTDAISVIESEFVKQGIAVIQDGPHFVVLFQKNQRTSVTNSLYFRGADLAANQSGGTVPAGAIILINVDAATTVSLYGKIKHRTILRPISIPGLINFKNTCILSEEEAAYGIATALALNGVGLVDDGDKFVQAVPMSQRALITPRAPKADVHAELLKPSSLPSTGSDGWPKRVSRLERELEKLRKELYDFINYKGPPDRSPQRLLNFYARIVGKSAETSTNFDGMPIVFYVNNALTKSELAYAIKTTFELNSLKIVPVDNERIRLERSVDTPVTRVSP